MAGVCANRLSTIGTGETNGRVWLLQRARERERGWMDGGKARMRMLVVGIVRDNSAWGKMSNKVGEKLKRERYIRLASGRNDSSKSSGGN